LFIYIFEGITWSNPNYIIRSTQLSFSVKSFISGGKIDQAIPQQTSLRAADIGSSAAHKIKNSISTIT